MKICFVSGRTYPLIANNFKIKKIGGAELQQVLTARELIKRGVDVSFITWDYGQPDGENIDGIKIFKTTKPYAGIKYFRFFYPRLTSLWNALKRADADIYYVRCAGFLPGLLTAFCKRYNKKYIFAGAHDTDFIPGKIKINNIRDKFLYIYGLRYANAIIVQSDTQKKLLKEHFGLEGIVIRNFSPYPIVKRNKADDLPILWVSTIRSWKRPMLFVKLAQRLPNEKFIMIGGRSETERRLYDEVVRRCDKIPNINFLGFLPYDEADKYFSECKLFVNTSIHEGFPNTFLQAWRCGVPVISFVDPDGVIRKYHLGSVVSSEDELVLSVQRMLTEEYAMKSEVIQNYYLQNHSFKCIDKFYSLLQELIYA